MWYWFFAGVVRHFGEEAAAMTVKKLRETCQCGKMLTTLGQPYYHTRWQHIVAKARRK